MDEFNYGFDKPVEIPFDAATERVMDALQSEGFGVLSDVDVSATLQEKALQFYAI